MSGDKKPTGGEAKSIRVASSKLITKEGTTEPKAVLSLYEDFLCPVCGRFEQQFGPTITQLIDSGAIAADYYMVAILTDRPNQNYSSRAAAAAYCVADEDTTPDKQAFRRFHAALYAQQPSETGTAFPTNAQLIETARQAGVGGKVPDCINSGRIRRHGQRSGRGDERQRHARPCGSTARTTSTPRPMRWSPRSRRSSVTFPG